MPPMRRLSLAVLAMALVAASVAFLAVGRRDDARPSTGSPVAGAPPPDGGSAVGVGAGAGAGLATHGAAESARRAKEDAPTTFAGPAADALGRVVVTVLSWDDPSPPIVGANV